ncbi:ROK family protein [Actinoplanes sp. CA-054009]
MTRPAGSSRLLRTMNASAALAHLLDPGMLTRADLRKLTALSTPTISEVLRRLTEAGLVTVAGHDSGRPGPSAEIYNINPEAAYAAAVSIRDVAPGGAPSVVAALCDLTGQVCARVESAIDFRPGGTAREDAAGEGTAHEGTAGEDAAHEDAAHEGTAHEGTAGEDAAREDAAREDAAREDAAGEGAAEGSVSDKSPEGTDPLTALADVLAELCDEAGVSADRVRHVQLGVPGSYDPRTETIHHVDVPGLGRKGLVTELAAALGTSVGVDNDVNLAAIAERRRGVGRDTESFALLWLGEDGLGLAIDLAGTLMRGARGGAGEIGYMPLYTPREKPAREQQAGERLARAQQAGERLAREQQAGEQQAGERLADKGPAGEKRDLHDLIAGPALVELAGEKSRTPTEVVHDARGEVLTEIADRIAVGVAAVIAVLDPHLVVLAGPIAQAGGVTLLSAVRAAMKKAAPLESEIAVTAIDDDAVLLGALDAGLTAVHDALLTDIRNS